MTPKMSTKNGCIAFKMILNNQVLPLLGLIQPISERCGPESFSLLKKNNWNLVNLLVVKFWAHYFEYFVFNKIKLVS